MYHFLLVRFALTPKGMWSPGSEIGIMAEWLRRQTRNLVGSALVGSNPADVENLLLYFGFRRFGARGRIVLSASWPSG